MLSRIADNTDSADEEALTEYDSAQARSPTRSTAAPRPQLPASSSAAQPCARSSTLVPPCRSIFRRKPNRAPRRVQPGVPRRMAARDMRPRTACAAPTCSASLPQSSAAYTMTTANTGDVVPTDIMNRSWVDGSRRAAVRRHRTARRSPMYADHPAHRNRAGRRSGNRRGAANDDEQNVWNIIQLTGVEIKKHVNLTRKMEIQSIDAFRSWLCARSPTV